MVATAILLGFGVHEYSHAQAADLLGDQTAKIAGRLTINPFAHFDPIGTLLIFIIGIGWGKPVPINPYNLRNQKWGSALVGLAGPFSNFVSALIVGFLLRFLPLSNQAVLAFFSIFVWINLTLGVFNLLPIPPLDGSHILFAVLPSTFAKLRIILLNPLSIIAALFFMYYIGFPYICRPLFTLITGLPVPF